MNGNNGRHCGGCLCGAIRFEIDGVFERFYLCHCEYCRKDTGSAFAANLFASNARLMWICGQENISRFDLPDTRHCKWFCSICGSALPHENGDLLAVPAGCLDTEVPLKADAHIFIASRAGWEDALEEIPMMAKFPA